MGWEIAEYIKSVVELNNSITEINKYLNATATPGFRVPERPKWGEGLHAS